MVLKSLLRIHWDPTSPHRVASMVPDTPTRGRGAGGFVSGRGSAVSALQMPPHHLAAAHTPERRDTSGQMCPVIPETDQPSAVHSHS
ncbi:unnamed protein product [Vitrella brassicaformis CCMP3155]|uniref:Uncharacterized protein n=1 Tax=Vitrella brassicaformis (strain CCMP3155) TaxID=1169540 RepID=A0A0G4EGT0_VITBC|nr:unnamed protein product [Vitrella brassicaformis CCMP3155]|eukprot:CEL94710.1 unnamed protein product [Vitrella brassicaformis CCMP3155]